MQIRIKKADGSIEMVEVPDGEIVNEDGEGETGGSALDIDTVINRINEIATNLDTLTSSVAQHSTDINSIKQEFTKMLLEPDGSQQSDEGQSDEGDNDEEKPDLSEIADLFN